MIDIEHDLGDEGLGIPLKVLGEIVESVGTPDFVSEMARLLHRVVPLDVLHIERSRADATLPIGYQCEWIGSSGISMRACDISAVMGLYYDRFFQVDPLFAGLRGKSGTLLALRDIAAMPSDEFRQRLFDDVHIAHECVLAHGTRYSQLSISLERGDRRSPFSLDELGRLRRSGVFLFPLLQLHGTLTAARHTTHPAGVAHPLALFDVRLSAHAVALSRREYETCRQLLSGRTIPETAEIIGVRPSSIECYVKRAFLKLGVHTRRELFAWCMTPPSA